MNIEITRDNKLDYKAMATFKAKLIIKEYFNKVDYFFVNHEWPTEGDGAAVN